MPNPVPEWIKLAKHKGWTVKRSGKGHLRWYLPDGTTILNTSNPHGNHYSQRNTDPIRDTLKKAGLFDQEENEMAPKGSPALYGAHYGPEEDHAIVTTVGPEYVAARRRGESVPIDSYYTVAARLGREAESVRNRTGYLYNRGKLKSYEELQPKEETVAEDILVFDGPEDVVAEPVCEPAEPEPQPETTDSDGYLQLADVAPALATLETMVFELAEAHSAFKAEIKSQFDLFTYNVMAELKKKYATYEVVQDLTVRFDKELKKLSDQADPLAKFRSRL